MPFDLKQGIGTAAQAAMAFLAAKKAGPQAVAALLGAIRQANAQAQQQQQSHADQQYQREREGRLDASTLDTQRMTRENLQSDNARADREEALRRLLSGQGALESFSAQTAETATDPIQAENAVMQRGAALSSAFGLAPDALSGFVPNMAPALSNRDKKRAQDIINRIDKDQNYDEYRKSPDGVQQIEELNYPWRDGETKKIHEIRVMAGTTPTTDSGTMLPPKAKPQTQLLDLGGRKVVIDPTQLQPGQTFTDVPSPSTSTERFWVMRNGQPVRITEAEYRPGDAPVSSREQGQGRPVTSGDASKLAELDTSLDDLNVLARDLGQTGAASKVGAMLPNVVTEFTGWGESAKQRQAVIDRVKQVIGKALEGGVLRKEDEYKYVKILPTIGDPPEVAKTKIDGLRTAITLRRERTLESLTDAGFDVSKFTQRAAPAAKADPLGIR